MNEDKTFKVATFYCFTAISRDVIISLLDTLPIFASKYNVKGSILLAKEGVNGTISGSSEGVHFLLLFLHQKIRNLTLELKFSWSKNQAFRRFKARRKNEIVTIGIPSIDPTKSVGTYIEPLEWNAFIKDRENLVIDTRNKYEISIGSFDSALNPNTQTFREFPDWVERILLPIVKLKRPKKIGMYCTGGIRCEKATSYLQNSGFQDVHHLKGGILRYLQDIPEAESLWNGECFVFDQRVSLDNKLAPGTHHLCYACGHPLSPMDRQKTIYVKGVQCHHCVDFYNETAKSRFAERQAQYDQLNR